MLNRWWHISVVGAFLSINAWAGDDRAINLEEESQATRQEVAQEQLPQAANVDLREPVSDPLVTPGSAGPAPASASASADEAASAGAVPTGAAPAEAKAVPLESVLPEVEVEKPFNLLGVAVAKSTATRLAWSPSESFAGIAAPTPVLVVRGRGEGPKLCLTAAVHGDELNGIEIVRRVMYNLEPEALKGTVIGVPIVNLQGFHRASRYLPDRRDLNRYFPGRAEGSSASRIAHSFFDDVVRHCDFLVDLHTGSFRRTNLPQLRADLTHPKVAELVQNMGAMVVLQSRGARGSLRRAATDAGIPSVTLEAGEPLHVQSEAVEQGVKSVETLLHKMDMYPQRGLWARKTAPVYYKSQWVRAPKGGILVSQVLLGERVKRGDVLGTVTDPITNHRIEVAAPVSGRVIGMALNQIMMPGFAAYHIGYQTTAKEASTTDVGPDDQSGDDAETNGPLSESAAPPVDATEAAE